MSAPKFGNSPKPLWIARLAGNQVAMGRQHGEWLAAAGGGDAVVEHYRDLPAKLLLGDVPERLKPPAARVVQAVSSVLLRRLGAARPAELAARSEAFFAGLGRPSEWGRYYGVMDLFQNYVGVAARWGVGPFGRRATAAIAGAAIPACSTVVAWDGAGVDGRLVHARTFDFPGIGVWDAAPAIVLCHPERGQRYGFITTRGGDTPVVTVWNEAGLVVTSHTRFHRHVGFGGATIVDLVHEIGRRAETLADAERIAREREVASTWGLAVSSSREERAIVLEVHAGRVATICPGRGRDYIVCCNRYRDPSMHDGEVTLSPAWALHSDRREVRLATLLAAAQSRGGARPLDFAAMLADRRDDDAPAIERHLGAVIAQPNQVQSVVIVPSMGALWLGVNPAPVGEGRWMRVDWEWDGKPGAWDTATSPPVGLGITLREGGTIPRSPAADAAATALRIEQSSHDRDALAAALDRAIAAAPRDPSLRLAQVWSEMRRGRWMVAVGHAAAGLEVETLPYRRGQLLLWGSRAAVAAGQPERARGWREEIEALCGAGVPYLQNCARSDRHRHASEFRRPPSANIFMHEAT